MEQYNEVDVRWFVRAAFCAGVVLGLILGGVACALGVVWPMH